MLSILSILVALLALAASIYAAIIDHYPYCGVGAVTVLLLLFALFTIKGVTGKRPGLLSGALVIQALIITVHVLITIGIVTLTVMIETNADVKSLMHKLVRQDYGEQCVQ